jgi:hypothetical protein
MDRFGIKSVGKADNGLHLKRECQYWYRVKVQAPSILIGTVLDENILTTHLCLHGPM